MCVCVCGRGVGGGGGGGVGVAGQVMGEGSQFFSKLQNELSLPGLF